MEVNCAVECVDGCKLGDKCPNQEHVADTAKFIEETSLDQMLEMAAAAVERRRMERMQQQEASTPQWVFPEDGIQPGDV
ncbi:hypothetical protein [Romeriopsis navalis]|nr:hypothetical protein [Romeriopsis navalis]